MFRIEMLPAREGDCLILTYGSDAAPKRVLIDGGRKATYADLKAHVETLPANQRAFELLIITHVDRDHIEGVLEMLADTARPMTFKEVWFNGYHHLQDGDFEAFGAVQGERLTEQLELLVSNGTLCWNSSFGPNRQKATALAEDGAPTDVQLDDGLILTLLSPSRAKLLALEPRWRAECEAAGIIAGLAGRDPDPEGFESFAAIDIAALAEEPFQEDPSEPNGSSIAVLAQYDGKRVLLSGDAHPGLLVDSLQCFANGGGPVKLDAFKVSHHGSRKNISKELLAAIDCPRFLFSTNGSYFDHPDPVAVCRVIVYGGASPELWFNYSSPETQIWNVPSWIQDHGYSVHGPDALSNGYQVLDL